MSGRWVFASVIVAWSALACAESDVGRCKDDDAPVPERIAACTRAIDSNRLSTADLGAAFYSRGNAWLDEGDYDRAIRDYNAAAQLLPQDVSVLNNRGAAWSAKGEHDRAIADYSEAMRIDPRHVDAIYNRGNAWRAKRDYDRAIADYTEALRLRPGYTFALHNRGIAWFNKGETDRAIADYSRAVRFGLAEDPQFAQAFLKRGIGRFSRHDFEAAEKDFAEADRLRRDAYSVTWLYLSRARAGVGAEEELRRAANAPSTDWPEPIPRLFLGLLGTADLMRLSGDGDTAKQLGSRCEARFYIAEWHLLRNEPRPAAEALREVVKSCPRDYFEYAAGVVELKRLEHPNDFPPDPERGKSVTASRMWTSAQDVPMASSPEDVAAGFRPFRCATVSLGGTREICNYFQQPATHAHFNAPNLATLWEFPVQSTSFTFDDDKLQEISWTFEARGQPGGNVIDPARLRGALESHFGPPASTHVSSMGRGGGIKVLDTTWLVNGERWVYRRYPEAAVNVTLHRFSKDAPGP